MMIPMSVNPVTGRAMDVEYMFRGIKYCPELLSISPEELESIEKTSMEYASLMCFRNRAVCRLTIYAGSIHNSELHKIFKSPKNSMNQRVQKLLLLSVKSAQQNTIYWA